jgi:hypothetical protein
MFVILLPSLLQSSVSREIAPEFVSVSSSTSLTSISESLEET